MLIKLHQLYMWMHSAAPVVAMVFLLIHQANSAAILQHCAP
jgi:hypothetical protein